MITCRVDIHPETQLRSAQTRNNMAKDRARSFVVRVNKFSQILGHSTLVNTSFMIK